MHLQEGAGSEAGAPRQVYGPGSGLLGHAEGLGRDLGALWRGKAAPTLCEGRGLCVCVPVSLCVSTVCTFFKAEPPSNSLIILHLSL